MFREIVILNSGKNVSIFVLYVIVFVCIVISAVVSLQLSFKIIRPHFVSFYTQDSYRSLSQFAARMQSNIAKCS